MDPHERGLLVAGQRGAGGAVCLVADDEVEVRQVTLGLGLVDHVNGLIGGEHHGHRIRVLQGGPQAL